MTRNEFYNQLINSEPLGFIDPLTDLGELDFVQMKFKEPVHQLINKYSGQPYNPNWQSKIEQMRGLYIQYQKSIKLEDESFRHRVRNQESKKYVHKIVTTYLTLGFKFKEIEKRLPLSYKQLIRGRKRSDYVTTDNPEFYLKKDLQNGYCSPNSFLPRSMKIN
ncbi:TPA: modification methylase Sau96I [Streptococcus suis]|uniref:modification methylase Sau96I n=1 Tax=Streptococcus suis TaxID=1307 RepID=UPI001ABDFB9F|nr:modification methylase Sau96I [Streptococcus suis]MBO4110236.1 modification methylase Sau96I [Streptococcus suis]HEM3614660.1 modification methylase Sau96I [Streptococcus suis]